MFVIGDHVGLAERMRGGGWDPVGTVVGFADDDVIVRWETGLETALAPWSLTHAPPADRPG